MCIHICKFRIANGATTSISEAKLMTNMSEVMTNMSEAMTKIRSTVCAPVRQGVACGH